MLFSERNSIAAGGGASRKDSVPGRFALAAPDRGWRPRVYLDPIAACNFISRSDAEISNLQVQGWCNILEIEPEDDDDHSLGADFVNYMIVPSLAQIELKEAVITEVDGLTTDALELSLEDLASLQISNLPFRR